MCQQVTGPRHSTLRCENAGLDGCEGCLAVLFIQLLRDHGADMTAADQDGTTPALIAAACGHCDVIRLLHESGVDLRAPGHIYSEEWTQAKCDPSTGQKYPTSSVLSTRWKRSCHGSVRVRVETVPCRTASVSLEDVGHGGTDHHDGPAAR